MYIYTSIMFELKYLHPFFLGKVKLMIYTYNSIFYWNLKINIKLQELNTYICVEKNWKSNNNYFSYTYL